MDITKDTVVRCFVAVEIPASIQELLKPVQTDLQSHIRKGTSWAKPGNFHLTLKFLGDVRPEKIDVVSEAIQRVADTHSPFSIEFGGIGAFPNLARPRVIWVGVKDGASIVSRLAKTVNLELAHLGFPTDNRFHPHLTLARLRTAINLEPLKNILRKYNTIDDAAMSVNEITLMQSQLHPSGAVYTPLRLCYFSA
ncbi:MAG: RNA 2',3'-cyclic phosphodiesterase [Candidatus Poribacteria bacterium]|nr:RNA 2',3'-cyclic phosphodiesterase [Candidatus Poribacteria bacterium]